MPYDALGNYNPGLESQQPSIDDMRLALMRQRQQPAVTAPPAAKLFGDIARGGLSNLESVARGAISAVPGAPGDLEAAIRALANWSFGRGGVKVSEQTVLPTSAELRAKVPRLLQARPESTGMEEIGALGNLPGQQLGLTAAAKAIQAAPRAPAALLDALASGPSPGSLAAQRGAIKMKGLSGNWLANSVEKATEPLKKQAVPQQLAEEFGLGADNRLTSALNDWVDTRLTKYIKNEMATPEDPVRVQADTFAEQKAALLAKKEAQIQKAQDKMEQVRAERGAAPEELTRSRAQIRALEKERDYLQAQTGTHLTPEQAGVESWLPTFEATRRKVSGFPEQGYGKSEPAIAWENMADTVIQRDLAGNISAYPIARHRQLAIENPWVTKVAPDVPIYAIESGSTQGLKFDHLMDELKNALDPNSGLPKHLQLGVDDIPKLTVPRAVKLVDEINAWRTIQEKEANLALASNRATSLIKEYPDTGMRWVELKLPDVANDTLPPGYSIKETPSKEPYLTNAKGEVVRYLDPTNPVQDAYSESGRMALEDALKYEGDMLAHCVGGYCEDVIGGNSRIVSLRDETGKPHATIQLKPFGKSWISGDYLNQIEPGLFDKYLAQRQTASGPRDIQEFLRNERPDIFNSVAVNQIKGYQNSPPAKYVEEVKDYLNSLGPVKFTDEGREDLQRLGLMYENGKYMTEKEVMAELQPQIDAALKYLETSPRLEKYREAERQYDAFKGKIPSPEFSAIDRIRGESVTSSVPYTYRELRNLLKAPEDYVGRNENKFDILRDNLKRIEQVRNALDDATLSYVTYAGVPYTPKFSAVRAYDLPRNTTVYHATDTEPVISTNADRFIPNSLSAATRPDAVWGKNIYELKLPRGARVGELNSIFDLLPPGVEDTPMNMGAALRKYAEEQSLDALKIRKVGGVGTEWVILNPEYLKGGVNIKPQPQGFADGGQARKLPDPSLANATLWAETVSRQMYPSPDENVKRDAARHMMAAAIIANRTSPGVAEALGKAHELYGAPFKTMGHWLGLSQPRPDYPTDVHNNALGASMANLAANPEMLKQAIRDAIAKGTTQGIEPGKPALIPDQVQGMGYAAGGSVTPDDMRLALMMRKAN